MVFNQTASTDMEKGISEWNGRTTLVTVILMTTMTIVMKQAINFLKQPCIS